MDDIRYATDDEDRPLDHVTASNVFRHFRPENTLLRSELSDFTLYRNQREVREDVCIQEYEHSTLCDPVLIAKAASEYNRRSHAATYRQS